MQENNKIDFEIRQHQRSIRYDMRTLPIDLIVDRFRSGKFYIPSYQRKFVWSLDQQSNFIESIIIGLPTAPFYIAETEDGREEIMDGAQRIQTLEKYVNGDLRLKNLSTITSLNGTHFHDIPSQQRNKFLNRSLSFIVLSHDTTFESRFEIFQRINVGGTLKNHQELRAALFLNDSSRAFISELANHPDFLSAAHLPIFLRDRGETEEFIIRFFALSDDLDSYKGDMNKFLDRYTQDTKFNLHENRMRTELHRTSIFVKNHLGDIYKSKNIRPTKNLFDAIFVGSNLSLRVNENLFPRNIDWIHNKEFHNLLTIHAAQTTQRLKSRIFFVRDHLLQWA